ncbi:MAG: hypothetical protein AAFX99_15430 [Myxococcota bacterium]
MTTLPNQPWRATMGHMINNIERMFRGVSYCTKTTQDVRIAMENKVEHLARSIDERNVRVTRLCEEHTIQPTRLADLILQYQNSDSDVVSYQRAQGHEHVIPAGVIANIIREKEMIESEREQAHKLRLILRNLCETDMYTSPDTGQVATRVCIHTLTDSELEYLGF